MGWFFTAPFGLIFVIFLVVPLVYAFYVSLFSYSQVFGERFTGLANYQRVFTDPIFLKGMGRVILYTVVMVPIQLGLALIFALLLDTLKNKFGSISRLLIFLPYAIPGVIGALMWGFMYSKNMGPFTSIFELFGLQAPAFLSPNGIFGALVNVVTWQWTGYYMVILYSVSNRFRRSFMNLLESMGRVSSALRHGLKYQWSPGRLSWSQFSH